MLYALRPLFHPRRMCGVLLVALLSALAAGTASGQALQEGSPMLLHTEPSRALLEQARTDLLYLRLDAAEARLRQLQRRSDGAPAALHHLALTALLRGFLTDDTHHFDRFAARSDSLKALLAALPRSRWSIYLEAEADVQRAVVWGRLEKLTKAALAGRSAFKGLEEASAGAPRFAEPLKGLGLMHMVIGSLPSGYRRLLRVLGYRGSVHGGRQELLRAATESVYNREEARLLLAVTDVVIRSDNAAAVGVIEPLYRAHPLSPLVAHVYGYSLLSNGEADAAARVYAPVVDERGQGQLRLTYATFYYADARFKQNRFDEAARLFQQYLRNHRGPSLRAAAQLSAALSLEMLERRGEALPLSRQIRHTRTSETEEMAVRRARERLAAPMTADEKTLLRARNALEGGRTVEADGLLQPLLARRASLDSRTFAHVQYLAARVADAAGRAEAALGGYSAVIERPGPEPLDGLVPWSHYYAGQLRAAQGQREAARRHYEAALAAQGRYDRYLSLEQYVRTAREAVR